MAKSPDAFRTISEVADWLGVQAHVLRFWESKFAQVKPIKRAGGRRYYRPSDMLLLGGLKKVLHEDGLTIKGAQKLLREKGVGHVADLSQPLDDLTVAVIEGSSTPVEADIVPEASEPAVEKINTDDEPQAEPDAPEPELLDAQSDDDDQTTVQSNVPLNETSEEPDADAMPSFRARPRDSAPGEDAPQQASTVQAEAETDDDAKTPSAPPKPERIEVTLIHDHTQIEAAPSALSKVAAIRQLSDEHAQEIRPLLARLTRLRASMANPRKELRKD